MQARKNCIISVMSGQFQSELPIFKTNRNTNRNFTKWTEMNLELILMSENDIAEFKKNVQCAFQKGFEDVFGKCEETILPEKDIDQSLNGKGSVAYKAVLECSLSFNDFIGDISLIFLLLGIFVSIYKLYYLYKS